MVPSTAAPTSVDEVLERLATGVSVPLLRDLAVSQLDHALQTAALLTRAHPGDEELAVAGLVHDIGHLLPGSTDETHATDAARWLTPTLGQRVAGAVGLHVEAKRYLVANEPAYQEALGADSVASLVLQGGGMSAEEMAAFARRPGAEDAVALRRADDGAKVSGLEAGGLDDWAPVLRRIARRGG
jgi:predicted HD phosphohydrolase